MTKLERLAELIGMPVEIVKTEIDEGMVDILIALNSKNYYTMYCCEGHPYKEDDLWEGYLVFCDTYKFPVYPKNFYKVNSRKTAFYWHGKGIEGQKEFISELLSWANSLPTRPKTKVVTYHLIAKNKKSPNKEKLLCYTRNYEDIRCILNREDMDKYYDFELKEDIQYE